MTHDQLLKKILKSGVLGRELGKNEWIYDNKTNALRAVVELHKPEHSISGYRCTICFTATTYPCPTIQAIQEQLK